MIENSLRHNGLADSSPVTDVEGCYEISFPLKTTGNAFEMGSFRSASLIYEMAPGAFPACVIWFDHDNGNARLSRLVLNERPELMKGPGIMDIPVTFTGR
jgi:hypothetical protein